MHGLYIVLPPRGAEVVHHHQGVFDDKCQALQGVVGTTPIPWQVAGIQASTVVPLGQSRQFALSTSCRTNQVLG